MPRTKRIAEPQSQNGVHAVPGTLDLAEFFANPSAVIELTDPRDEYTETKRDTGFRVEIGPVWSPEARKIARENRNLLKLVDGEVDPMDPAVHDSLLEQIIGVTKRWWQVDGPKDGITMNGAVVPCTPETVRALYTNPQLAWIYDQVRAGYLDKSRFFGQPPKTA